MKKSSQAICVVGTVVILIAVSPASAQRGSLSGVVVKSTEAEDGSNSMLLGVGEPGDEPITQVDVALGKKAARGAVAELLPSGWRIVPKGKVLRAEGPAIDPPVYLRWVTEAGVDLPQSVGVEVFSGTSKVYDDDVEVSDHAEGKIKPEELGWVLSLPPSVAAGETIVSTVIDARRAPPEGQWMLGSAMGRLTGVVTDEIEEYQVVFDLPEEIPADEPLDVVYIDPWGEATVPINVGEEMRLGQPREEDPEPRIDSTQRYVFQDGSACICGNFPTVESRVGLEIGGRPIGEPVAASSSAVVFRVPGGVAPGPQPITGASPAGFLAGAGTQINVLALSGSIDKKRLQTQETTKMHIVITGTQAALPISLMNVTPAIIQLVSGIAWSSGGAVNTLDRDVLGLHPGDFHIEYEVANDPCPCGPSTEIGESPLVAPQEAICKITKQDKEHDDPKSHFRMSKNFKDEKKRAMIAKKFSDKVKDVENVKDGNFTAGSYMASTWAIGKVDSVGGYANGIAKTFVDVPGEGLDRVWETELLETEAEIQGTHGMSIALPEEEACESIVVGAGGGVVQATTHGVDFLEDSRAVVDILTLIAKVLIEIAKAGNLSGGVGIGEAFDELDEEWIDPGDHGRVGAEGELIVVAGRNQVRIKAESKSAVGEDGEVDSGGAKLTFGVVSGTNPVDLGVLTFGEVELLAQARGHTIVEGSLESQTGVALMAFCYCKNRDELSWLDDVDASLVVVGKKTDRPVDKEPDRANEMIRDELDTSVENLLATYLDMPREKVVETAREKLPGQLEDILWKWLKRSGSDGHKFFDFTDKQLQEALAKQR